MSMAETCTQLKNVQQTKAVGNALLGGEHSPVDEQRELLSPEGLHWKALCNQLLLESQGYQQELKELQGELSAKEVRVKELTTRCKELRREVAEASRSAELDCYRAVEKEREKCECRQEWLVQQLKELQVSRTAAPSLDTTSQNFSFAIPMTVTDSISPLPGAKQTPGKFGFTVPKSHSHAQSSCPGPALTAPFSQQSILQSYSRKDSSVGLSIMAKPRPKEPTSFKQPLPLKSGSIEEVFKGSKPPVKGRAVTTAPDKRDVINLTDSGAGSKQLPSVQPLAQFAPPAGSWTCTVCCVSNKANSQVCVCCQSSKPSTTSTSISSPLCGLITQPSAALKPSVSSSKPSDPSSSSKPSSSLSKPSVSSSMSKPSVVSSVCSAALKAQFAPPTGSWECEVCMISNKAGDSVCVACCAPNTSSSKPAPVLSSKPALATMFAASVGSWECKVCMVRNKSGDSKCVACSSPRPGTEEGEVKIQPVQSLSEFAPPKDSWSCKTCMVSNKADALSCVCCSTPKSSSAETGVTAKKTDGSGQISFGKSGGLKLGVSGGFGLGGAVLSGKGEGFSEAASTVGSGGFKLGGGMSLGATTGIVPAGGFKLGSGVSLGGGKASGVGTSDGDKAGCGLGRGISLGGASTGIVPAGGFKLGSGVSLGGGKASSVDTSEGEKVGRELVSIGASEGFKVTGLSSGAKSAESGLNFGQSGGLKLTGGISIGGTGMKLGGSSSLAKVDNPQDGDNAALSQRAQSSAGNVQPVSTPLFSMAPQKATVPGTSILGGGSNLVGLGQLVGTGDGNKLQQAGLLLNKSASTGLNLGGSSSQTTPLTSGAPLKSIAGTQLNLGAASTSNPLTTVPSFKFSGGNASAQTTTSTSGTPTGSILSTDNNLGIKFGATTSSIPKPFAFSAAKSDVPSLQQSGSFTFGNQQSELFQAPVSVALGGNTGGGLGVPPTSQSSGGTLGLSSNLFGSVSSSESASKPPVFQFSAATNPSTAAAATAGTGFLQNISGGPATLKGFGGSGMKIGGSTGLNIGVTPAGGSALNIGGTPGGSGLNIGGTPGGSGLNIGGGSALAIGGSGLNIGTPGALKLGGLGGTAPLAFGAQMGNASLLGGTTGTAGSQQTNTPFHFGGNPPSAPTNTFMSAGIQGQQQPPGKQQQQQQPPVPAAFQFGQPSAPAGASAASTGSSGTQGYNFTLGSGPNLNFGSQTMPSTFSASNNNSMASASEMTKRVIKKATRRKKL